MLLSMTGYGRAETRDGGRNLVVEIRTVNHRFAEISIRLPKSLAMIENRVRDRMLERLSRGKITLSVNLEGDDGEMGRLKVDEAVANRYATLLRELKKKLNLSGDLDIGTFVGLAGRSFLGEGHPRRRGRLADARTDPEPGPR